MSLLTPDSTTQLRNMIGGIGGGAGRLAGLPTPGTNDIRSTFGAMQNAPSTVLPGGGTLEGANPLSQYLSTGVPAATLPLQQGEAGRKMGLAGIQGGAGQLQTEDQTSSLAFQQSLQDQLSKLLYNVGIPSGTSSLAGGGLGILAKLLGI